jgi:GTPase SAR1 family protein
VTWTPDPQSPSLTMAQMRQMGEEKAACMSLRAIVIGQENVGKTTLVDTLYRSLNDEGLMKHQLAKWKKRFQERKEGRQWTDGIEICNTLLPNLDPTGSPLSLNIWDFAGQAVYYPTHQLFLPDHAMFIVVFDLSLPSSVARVHYWLDSIASNVSKSPPVLLVGTHKDKCSNWEEICESVRSRHASRRDVDVRGVHAIRATQMGDMMPIRQALQTVVTTSKLKEWVGRKFPRSFTFLASVIREENMLTRNPIISRAEFRNLAACFGILKDEQLEECVAWLSYIGAILEFPRMIGIFFKFCLKNFFFSKKKNIYSFEGANLSVSSLACFCHVSAGYLAL